MPKTIPADAEIALDILLCHPEIQVQSVYIRTLATLVEARRGLAANIVRLTLKQYYPQVQD